MKIALSILGSLLFSASLHAEQKPYNLLFSETPPFSIVVDGQPKGVAINIVGALFAKAQLPYKLQNLPLVRAMNMAQTEAASCVFPVQRAQNIEAQYQWVSPILITRSGLFVAPQSTIALIALADAKQLKVGAVRGSGDAEYLKSFGFVVEETNSQEQNVQKLLAKRIDVWATDLLSAKYFTEQAAAKDQAPRQVLAFRTSLGSLACNLSTPKADLVKLQVALDAMISDGTLDQLATAAP